MTDVLNKLPLIPIDWANHIVYGGVGGVALQVVGVTPIRAALSILALGAVKKIYDYFTEQETIQVCVGKTLVTALWPASFLIPFAALAQ